MSTTKSLDQLFLQSIQCGSCVVLRIYVRVHDLHASKLQSPNSHFTFAKVDLLNVSQQMGQSVLLASIVLVCLGVLLSAFECF